MAKDFRYRFPDESVVEGFQVTEKTRYRETEWPDWMDSRFLINYGGGQQRLLIDNVETIIPKKGWIIRHGDGRIEAVADVIMENAVKVVQEKVVVHPRADAGITDEQLAAAAGIELPEDHVEPDTSVDYVPGAIEDVERPPENVVALPTLTPDDQDLLFDARSVFERLCEGDFDGAKHELHMALAKRTDWCNCPPGICNKEKEDWGCRKFSPLA